MDGPEAAQARLEQYLAAAVPAQLDVIAAAHNIDRAAELPNPTIQPAGDISLVPIKQWPFYTVSILDTLSIDRVDADVAEFDHPADVDEITHLTGPSYRVTYLARVFTFARGDTHAVTSTARNRYALALRMAILGRPSLASADAAVDEASWRESFSGIDTDSRRTIGAAYAEFRLTLAEDLTVAAPNYVDTLEVFTVSMPTAEAETT